MLIMFLTEKKHKTLKNILNKIKNTKFSQFKIINLFFNFVLISIIFIGTIVTIFLIFVHSIYDKVEFYENEIKIYSQDNLVTVKYKEINTILFDYTERSSNFRGDIRKRRHITLNIYLKLKDKQIKIFDLDIFRLDSQIYLITKSIKIFKSQNIPIKIIKLKEDLFKSIRYSYIFEYDERRVINDLNLIFSLL